MLHEKEMRAVYADTLVEMISANRDILCFEADLGKSQGTYPKVADAHPDNFIQSGIAEANMIGVAVGASLEGKVPFCATFSAFATRRTYDQISISVAYAAANVKIVGSAPGVTQAFNGGTHMCFQDLSIMRAMPNMTIYSPADAYELKAMLKVMAAEKKPTYLQLIREKMPQLFDEQYVFVPGKAVKISDGTSLTLVTTGLTTSISVKAVKALSDAGITVDHLHYPTVKPFDAEALIASAKKTGKVLTVENQNIIGGLGGAVCEVLSERHPVPVKRLGINDSFGEVGPVDYLIKRFGFSDEHIVAAAKEICGK